MLHLHRATEEFLNALCWFASLALKPTLGNLTGLSGYPVSRAQLYRLEEAELIARERDKAGKWIYRLTRNGKLAALGGRIPPQAWNQSWDGEWRMLLFDISSKATRERQSLASWLHASHFGCLQRSVWVTPWALSNIEGQIKKYAKIPGSILIMEGSPISGPKRRVDKEIVKTAWDFEELNKRYQRYLRILNQASSKAGSADWQKKEHQAWMRAIKRDPLLPSSLLPSDYLGKKAWKQRAKVLRLSEK